MCFPSLKLFVRSQVAHRRVCVHEALAVAVHGGVGHGPQVDEETKLVASEILCQVHVGPARVRVRVEVTGEFIPHVSTTDALGCRPGWAHC